MLQREAGFGPVVEVAGVPFRATTLDGAVDRLLAAALRPRALALRFSNAYCLAIADRDEQYRALLAGTGVTLPDGAPVARVLRLLAGRQHVDSEAVHLVRGPSFFAAALRRSAGTGVRHYFLGGSDETIGELGRTVAALDPAIDVAGASAPAFGPVDEAFLESSAAAVRASGANLLWVALGTPKQDYAGQLLAERLDMPVAAVGAAFDFTAGTVREAPRLLRGHGLEWLFRLSQDPRRLWRRYAVGNTRFLALAARALLAERAA